MWAVARRPRWIATLLLALGIAAAFAALGQWQLDRSVASGTVVERDTETVKPITEVTKPQQSITPAADGQRVRAEGEFVAGDFSVLGGRIHDGVEGYWVIGHYRTTESDGAAALAVALGWAPTRAAATSALTDLDVDAGSVTGRYVAADSPEQGDFENGESTALAPPALINTWGAFTGDVFAGYLVLDDAPRGLQAIDSPVPSSEVAVNWLNIFYAVEWAVFAVFAIFLWYRLVRDAWEREVELEAEAAAERDRAGSEVTGPTSHEEGAPKTRT